MLVPHPESFVLPFPMMPAELLTGCGARGLPTGTLVETAMGWRPVEWLEPGDLIATVEGALRPLRTCALVAACGGGRIMVPKGVLHNNRALSLPENQLVMVDGMELERLFEVPMALVPVANLVGLHGIRPGGAGNDIWQLRFDAEEVVWADGGMCLHCPPRRPGMAQHYRRLSEAEAARLVRAITGSARRRTSWRRPAA